jgi:hypothetical protein
MSDLGRKGLGEQASEKSKHASTNGAANHDANGSTVTPDSQKSTTEKAGETVSGLGDKAASAVQPGQSLIFQPFHQPSTNS